MYTHYITHYSQFEALTKYPKFCHGLGQFHKNPRSILSSPVDNGFVELDDIEMHLLGGMNMFVDEVDIFLKEHMPVIEASGFFKKLIYDPDVQIPLIVSIVNDEVKNDIIYKAYTALRTAVNEKFSPKSQQQDVV